MYLSLVIFYLMHILCKQINNFYPNKNNLNKIIVSPTKLDFGGIYSLVCCQFLIWAKRYYSHLHRNCVSEQGPILLAPFTFQIHVLFTHTHTHMNSCTHTCTCTHTPLCSFSATYIHGCRTIDQSITWPLCLRKNGIFLVQPPSVPCSPTPWVFTGDSEDVNYIFHTCKAMFEPMTFFLALIHWFLCDYCTGKLSVVITKLSVYFAQRI